MDITEAVARLKDRYPGMTIEGLECKGRQSVAGIEDLIAEALRFPEDIALCRTWLAQQPASSAYAKMWDTLTYKHDVELWAGEWVSHLSFLIAAEMEGWTMKPHPDRPAAAMLRIKRDVVKPGRSARN